MEILDHYILTRPTGQNAIDIFQGEWSSLLPDELGLVTKPGTARLFEDGRITWAEQCLGAFANQSILELGPLEGGHSYMFQKAGARKVVAIEANTRCYLKCLCIKEVLKLDRVEFQLGDFVSYLANDPPPFDMVVASGVLYHMKEPLELLRLIANAASRVFIWTHYFDRDIIAANPVLAKRFSPVQSIRFEGESYECSTQTYREERTKAAFCGGPKPESNWLTRDSLARALGNFGFRDVQFNFEQPLHPNGPSLALCARK